MCGRYSITLLPEAVRELFQTHGSELLNWPACYNAAPTTGLLSPRRRKKIKPPSSGPGGFADKGTCLAAETRLSSPQSYCA